MNLRKGDLLKTTSGDWHEVVKVEGPGHVQSTNGYWSLQSHNEGQTKQRVLIFDGYKFVSWRSIEEIEKLYTEVKSAQCKHCGKVTT